MILFHVIAV